MKIGVLVKMDKDIEQEIKKVHDLGMTSCQLCCWDNTYCTDENAEIVKMATAKYGVDVSTYWCGWSGPKVWDFYEGPVTLGLVPEDYRYARIKELKSGSDFAKKIHVTDLATHVGYMPENPYDPKYEEVLVACKAIVEKCKENGQNFLFETGQETPVTLKRAIQDIEKTLGKGNIGINLDPANLIMYGKANPVDALEVFGEYVRGIHGKDGKYPTDGHHLGDEVPLGQGKVNYPAFIAKLKEIGYEGDITIEREISGEQQIADIRHAKELLSALIG